MDDLVQFCSVVAGVFAVLGVVGNILRTSPPEIKVNQYRRDLEGDYMVLDLTIVPGDYKVTIKSLSILGFKLAHASKPLSFISHKDLQRVSPSPSSVFVDCIKEDCPLRSADKSVGYLLLVKPCPIRPCRISLSISRIPWRIRKILR